MSFESFINNMMSDFAAVPEDMFTVHERGFLLEKAVVLESSGDEAGTFQISNKVQYGRLEDKILFLVARVTGESFDKSTSLWNDFIRVKRIRDSFTHPKRDNEEEATPENAELALNTIRELIGRLASTIWHKGIKV